MTGPLKDGYLYDLTPAELIAWVAQVTLATISNMTTAELVRIGWYNNPVVDILYSMTSAGVWVARTDTYGRQKTSDIYTQQIIYGTQTVPTIGQGSTDALTLLYRHQRKAIVAFSSNAGGSIDSDPELVPAFAGYYGVMDELRVLASSAETPLFEIQEGATAIGQVVSPGTLVASQGKDTVLPVKYGGTDNAAISLDGSGCSNLGNAVDYELEVTYHYET